MGHGPVNGGHDTKAHHMDLLTRSRRPLAAPTVVAVLLVAAAAPAAAAPPTNDAIASATAVTTLPFADSLDTTEATRSSDEPFGCFDADATVWYAFTPASDTFVEFNTLGSDYDTTLEVYEGEPTDETLLTCNDDVFESLQSRALFDAAAGTTYYVMVGALGEAGQLELAAFQTVSPPPVALSLTLDGGRVVDPPNRTAYLTGTISCENADFVDVFGELEQRVGRVIISGYGGEFLPCEGGPVPFELRIEGDNGLFVPGRADAFVSAFACNDFECGDVSVEQEVRLRRARR